MNDARRKMVLEAKNNMMFSLRTLQAELVQRHMPDMAERVENIRNIFFILVNILGEEVEDKPHERA